MHRPLQQDTLDNKGATGFKKTKNQTTKTQKNNLKGRNEKRSIHKRNVYQGLLSIDI